MERTMMSRRKALGLSVVTATAAGLILSRRWSRSEGALATQPVEGDHEDWHLTAYLHAASESTTEAIKIVARVARAVHQAWERQQAAAVAATTGQHSSSAAAAAALKPTPAMLLADFLAALNEGGPVSQRPGCGTQLLNSQLADWLLERAAAPAADPQEQRAILRYLSAVLCREEAAEALLQHPGAAHKLLALAGQSFSLQQLLAAAVEHSTPPAAVPPADMEAVLALLAAEQQERRARHQAGAAHQQQLLLGLQLLLCWARASALNAVRLAEAGTGRVLAELATASSATDGGMDGLQSVIVQLMGVLAHDTRKPQQLHMQGWLYHLLCFAADTSAGSQWQLADASLGSFATCLLRGCELPPQLMERSTLPLLHRLAAQSDCPVRPAIALVVQALAAGPGVHLPVAERERWMEMLLQWLVQEPEAAAAGDGVAQAKRDSTTSSSKGEGAAAGRTQGRRRPWPQLGGAEVEEGEKPARLQERAAAALVALSAPAGSEGLHVAHAWLAELIVHLSHQVQPLPLEPKAAAPAAAPSSNSRGVGGGSWWWPWGGSTNTATTSSTSSGSSPPNAAATHDTASNASSSSPVAVEGCEATAAGVDAGAAAVPAPAADDGTGASLEGPYLPLDEAVKGTAADGVEAASNSGGDGRWWWLGWWPWGGGAADQAGDRQQAAKAASKPSDSELALYINAAPIGPVYARSVAAALLEASGRVGSFKELPANAEELMGPDVVAVYPQVAAAIDWDLADMAVCQALKVLCALASGGGHRRAWLLNSGILPLLHRLTMERARDVVELPPAAGVSVDGSVPLCIQRQAVRLLAMLAADQLGAAEVQDAGWIPWLQDLAVSTDLKLSSCASRALLHIESAAATQRRGLDLAQLAAERRLPPLHAAPLLPTEQQGAAAAAAAAAAAGAGEAAGGGGGGSSTFEQEGRGVGTEAAEVAAEMLGEARLALAQVRRRLDRQLDVVRPAVPPQGRLVLQDGVHLFDPLAPHHEVLAREGVDADTSDAPLLDIVFVHGIRGGAFATWRREGVLERGQARESLDRSVCWPASWVAREVPEARLLSLEYAAPASGWEGESLPFQHIVAQLMEKLAAAGVGQRPVIFVCHSMGGLVIKDLLVTAKQQRNERLRKLNTSAVGAVFYSVPHAGSRLADWGWYLRYIGGSPAKHVQRLRPGHHLEELNAAVRAMCKSGQLPVLSFNEGLPTKLGYIPTQVVPHESAYPGYGEFVVLQQHDHISVCKPSGTDDPAYARFIAFLHARVRAVRLARADKAAASMDHMESSVL